MAAPVRVASSPAARATNDGKQKSLLQPYIYLNEKSNVTLNNLSTLLPTCIKNLIGGNHYENIDCRYGKVAM